MSYAYEVTCVQEPKINGRFMPMPNGKGFVHCRNDKLILMRDTNGKWRIGEGENLFFISKDLAETPTSIKEWGYHQGNRYVAAKSLRIVRLGQPELPAGEGKALPPQVPHGQKIWTAAHDGDKQKLLDLLQTATKADLRFTPPRVYGRQTALQHAAHKGHAEIAQILVGAGFDLNAQNILAPKTPLMYATRNGHIATVLALIALGAKLDLTAENGETALMVAAMHGHLSIVQALIVAGANCSLTNKKGKGAADVAKTEDIRALITASGSPPAAETAPTPAVKKVAADPVPPRPPSSAPTRAPVPATAKHSARVVLKKECDDLAQQVALVPSHGEAVQQREALQQQYDAAMHSKDYKEVGALGQRLKALKQLPLPLSEEIYLTLAVRHAALIQRLENACLALVEAEDFVGVEELGAKLAMLKALDLSVLSRAATVTATVTQQADVESDDAWVNDPVYVPNDAISTMGATTAAVTSVQTKPH